MSAFSSGNKWPNWEIKINPFTWAQDGKDEEKKTEDGDEEDDEVDEEEEEEIGEDDYAQVRRFTNIYGYCCI